MHGKTTLTDQYINKRYEQQMHSFAKVLRNMRSSLHLIWIAIIPDSLIV